MKHSQSLPKLFAALFVLLLSMGATGCLSRVNFWGLPCGNDRDCYKLRCLEGTCQSPPGDIYITSIEGDGTRKPISPPSSVSLPYHRKLAQQRFRQTWILTGNNLDLLKEVRLVKKDNPSISFDSSHGLNLGTSISKGVLMSRALKLPKTLVAGLFVLYGVLANQTFALAEVYVLQGEQGKSGSNINQELLTYLQSLKKYLKVEEPAKRLLVSGADLQIVNGSGQTSTSNGTGNLIVGYNEIRSGATFSSRKGSHNLVIGSGHAYDSAGGIVAGKDNTITGVYASILGGQNNTASGDGTSVLGGRSNEAKGEVSTVSGGEKNTSSGKAASVAGGLSNKSSGSHAFAAGGNHNEAVGIYSSALGGGSEEPKFGNSAYGPYSTTIGGTNNWAGEPLKGETPNPLLGVKSTVVGGNNNEASGIFSVILGGHGNKTTSTQNVVVGGLRNTADGNTTSIFGGVSNITSGYGSSVIGGTKNSASGSAATICGGDRNRATGGDSTVCGGLENVASDHNSLVVGGWKNTASGPDSVICGGYGNIADGDESTVTGGEQNQATGYRASVLGGYKNIAAGLHSTVVGGTQNTSGNPQTPSIPSKPEAPGEKATILGGQKNTATGKRTNVIGSNNKSATQDDQTVSP